MATTTMQDVARHAGVSVMTVSNVVNDHPHVRAATRQKVLDAIAELGYHVNTTARNLRQGRTGVIGLAVPEIDRPYYGLLASLLIERAAARGYELVIEQTSAERDRELTSVTRSRLRSYDGLILSAVRLHDHDATLLRGEFPLVVLGERSFSEPLDQVVMDNERGGRLATAHLIAQGSRRIGVIGGRLGLAQEIDVSTTRTRGYVAALADAGIALDEDLVRFTELSYEGGREAAARLLTDVEGLDGLFCVTDVAAVGAMRAVRDAGRTVPGDVRVVGFDDVALASHLTPSLTSIAPDHAAMADATIDLLLGRIDGSRGQGDYRTFVGPVELIARESSAS
ncbi:DNA-binding LacI/PurR family transcriptional regulator [Microbacterium terrae]|nr:LacI family DNA-binding transcriptional regulator [Microbacterium terrae]MBP1078470.1 DNA-binding LacI/PurR family transcriptional regulator [Microbacterium terrae]